MYETYFYSMGLVFVNTANFPFRELTYFLKRWKKFIKIFPYHISEVSPG